MTDYRIPELPSDDELGLTDDEVKHLPDWMRTLPEETAAGAPRSRWRGPVMFAALTLLAFLSSSSRALPDPQPASAADTAFSSGRAMAQLVEIARRAHPTGSPEHDRVRAYVVGRLRDLGLEPEVRTRTALIGSDTIVRGATVRNVVARIAGTASTGALVLTAHYDAAGISTGAGDDGTGVVAVLETVRALRAGSPPRNDVIVLITDAEELGLMGARTFVDEHPWMPDVSVVLSVEMRGGGGPSIMFETGEENGWIVREADASGIRPAASSVSYEIYRRMPNDTDFTPFRRAGRQGLNFAAIGRASVYHQAYDTPANLSEATLQHHGENLLGVTRRLVEVDLSEVDAPDVTFFSVPVLGLVVYPTGLALPLTAALVALAAVVFLSVRRTGGSWAGILIGLGIGIVAVAGTAGVGLALAGWLPRFHPEYGSLAGSTFHHEGWYVLALAGLGLALTTTLFGIARRWRRPGELAWGAALLPIGLAVWLSFTAPSAAMSIQWPTAAALLAILGLPLASRPRLVNAAWAWALVLALPVLAMMVPFVELGWMALGFEQAAMIGLTVAVLLLLLLPALDRLREPNTWWAPLSALVLAGAFLGLGVWSAGPSPERPAPSLLAWTYDRATGEALWIGDASDDPADAEARSWAEGRAGAPFTETRSLQRFGIRARGGGDPHVAPAPVVEVAAPSVWVLRDTIEGANRSLRLALLSNIGAELVQLRFPEGSRTRMTALNGQPLPIQDRARLVEHWGRPDPAILLDLTLPVDAAPELDVVEYLLRPGELLGEELFRRPPTLAPDVSRGSDRAVIRTPISALELLPGPLPELPRGETADPAAAADTAMAADSVAAGDSVAAADSTAAVDSIAAADSAAADSVPPPDTSAVMPDLTTDGRTPTTDPARSAHGPGGPTHAGAFLFGRPGKPVATLRGPAR